jgi:CO/xanthine dehydrogenase Mo-binding subunit
MTTQPTTSSTPFSAIGQRVRLVEGESKVTGKIRFVADLKITGMLCAQLAEVEVDPTTGFVQVHRLVVVQDVGRALNPAAIESQMIGGAMQGVGWALYEGMVYDEQGQPLTASWMDYNVPNFTQTVGAIEPVLVEVPSDYGPFGAKGVGEPPVTSTAAAIANAIRDAVGVRLTALPMTAPRVKATLG